MAKSLTFVIFTLGILIAQASNNEPKSDGPATASQTNADDVPWILPGFDKTQPPRISKSGTKTKKCWQNPDYRVCLIENPYIKMLQWMNKKSNFEVLIDVNIEGDITQDWKFQGTRVRLNLEVDNPPKQYWKFGSSSLQTVKYSDGTSTAEWNGNKRPEKVEEFKKMIDSWCEDNDFFVSKENCAIYDKTKFNNDPAWILTGFDKSLVSQVNNKKGKKCWVESKYHVCLTKRSFETKLYWKNLKSNTEVEMEINSGSIYQAWELQDNHVVIYQLQDGSVSQQWFLGSSEFSVNKDSDGTVDRKWRGDENPEALKAYQQFMDAWCENNDFFVGKENCLIYKV